MLLAFRVKEYQLVAPGWLNEVRVDIRATLPAGGTRQQAPEILQLLLAERFGLVTRRELRRLEVYGLVIGKDGVKMQAVEPLNELDDVFPVDPSLTSPAAHPAARALADRVSETPDGPVRTLMRDLGRTTLTARSMYHLKVSGRRTQILNATRMTMAELAGVLERVTGEPVIDKTGLTNHYQFTVELPPDAWIRQAVINSAISTNAIGAPLTEVSDISVSKELDKLGLRLQPERSQIETIVVDKIERVPTDS